MMVVDVVDDVEHALSPMALRHSQISELRTLIVMNG